ncbi:MAG: hypothetical protein CL969_00155 [Euryarchaeota archaeon]|nr:hypothetical protein [Euryarchaeota archaeon]MDP6575181.1 DUF1653 domain-containing protein [Candidatus Peribacteraceae bacterium]HCI03292.1 DUF1653 domain-containing protein [Candidatus Peribacteria bacterium]
MLEPGIYKHYKGKKYRVLGIAKHSETLEDLVVYEALYENENSKLWVRSVDMFKERLVINGREVPRFEFISSQ